MSNVFVNFSYFFSFLERTESIRTTLIKILKISMNAHQFFF